MRENEILQLMAICSVLKRMDAHHIMKLILRYFSGYLTVVYDSTQLPYSPDCLRHTIDALWVEYDENIEYIHGNLEDFLEKTTFRCTVGVNRIIFKNANTITCGPYSGLLFPQSTAGLVNDALLSLPKNFKVRVHIEGRMRGGEEGWKIFFKTISSLERVMFDIHGEMITGKLTPSRELLIENVKHELYRYKRWFYHPDFE